MSETLSRPLGYWRSARAVRERAETIFAAGLAGDLEHFEVELPALRPLAERVVAIAGAVYPDLRRVPVHGRYRHFDEARLRDLDARLAGLPGEARLAARADLVITSVLLDAGAGALWRYRDPRSGSEVSRSEGLALASYDWLVSGGLSRFGADDPVRADASCLAKLDERVLGRAFQVREDNPLVGLAGRVSLLSRLAGAVNAKPALFGRDSARPGNLAVFLAGEASARGGELSAETILQAILEGLGGIWPGRETLDGEPLGDVWSHSRFGLVPFHKLSQWLAYSLFEPLEQAGVRVVRPNELTGLAEYRNGGLFVDGGVIVARDAATMGTPQPVASDVIIEWRALTVALIDRLAAEIRALVALDDEVLPLAKVLEAGTWRAGRVFAFERRPDGSPPIRIESDGTVF